MGCEKYFSDKNNQLDIENCPRNSILYGSGLE